MKISDNQERIDAFIQFMAKKLSEIDNITVGDTILYKKVLYVSFLDSLAACIYPNRKSNRGRFIALIERFSEWPEKDKVCLIHLCRFTSINTEPELETIRNFLFEELANWYTSLDDNETVKCSRNPKFVDVQKFWKGSKETGLPYGLADFKLSNLLYQLRNSLVHQFQTQGREFANPHGSVPYYHRFHMVSYDGKFEPSDFELVYPTSFLSSLCGTVLNNVGKYFKKTI